jgi:hypothetical protein
MSQNLEDAFADFGRQFGKALADLGFIAAGQGAMGWMLQNEPEKARKVLVDLDDRQAAVIADAAELLASMIREDRK